MGTKNLFINSTVLQWLRNEKKNWGVSKSSKDLIINLKFAEFFCFILKFSTTFRCCFWNTYSSIYGWIVGINNILKFVHKVDVESFRRRVRFLRRVRTQRRVLFSTKMSIFFSIFTDDTKVKNVCNLENVFFSFLSLPGIGNVDVSNPKLFAVTRRCGETARGFWRRTEHARSAIESRWTRCRARLLESHTIFTSSRTS